jgi:Reverse transcriptase (RNA-dependent DNA polymerase)
LVNKVFLPFLDDFVVVYLDDILVYSATDAEHEQHLRSVLEALRQNHLKAKDSKCDLFLREVEFLGHIVSESGVAVDQVKVKAVKDWPTLTSAKDIQQFLGLAQYYHKFIEGFAKLARPLTDLLRKDVQFKWGREE